MSDLASLKEEKLRLAQMLAGMSDPERVEFVTSMLILAMEKQLNREPTVIGGPDNVKKIIDSQKERWTKQATNLVYWGGGKRHPYYILGDIEGLAKAEANVEYIMAAASTKVESNVEYYTTVASDLVQVGVGIPLYYAAAIPYYAADGVVEGAKSGAEYVGGKVSEYVDEYRTFAYIGVAVAVVGVLATLLNEN